MPGDGHIDEMIRRALAEDVGAGDVTTDLVVPRGATAKAVIMAGDAGRVAGLPVAGRTFSLVDASIEFKALVQEGADVKRGTSVAEIAGLASSIFKAERTAVNFLQHLSGIATMTARFVDEVKGFKAKIYDTRKTLPGLRKLEKYAVRVGGGMNHREGLFDAVLIKDNHLKVAGGVKNALKSAGRTPLEVEIEVENLTELQEALDAGAKIVLLDNMTPSELKKAVEVNAGKALLEASGGISLETVRAVAESGVDRISVGTITQGAPPLDFSLEVVEIGLGEVRG